MNQPIDTAEGRLRQLELVIEASRDGLWDWNLLNGDLYLSPRWHEQLGYEIGDLPPRIETLEAVCHPEDYPRVMEVIERHIDGEAETPYEVEHRFRTKSGEWKWILARGKVFRDDGGTPVRMVGTATDIHERKVTERELLMLKTAIDQAPVGIALADEDIRIYYCNPEGLGMRGGLIADLVEIPKDAFDNWQVFRTDGEPYEIDNLPLVRTVETGEVIREEFIVRHEDGSGHLCDAVACPVIEGGEIIGGIVIFLDITEHKEAETAARETAVRLREAVRAANIGLWNWDLATNEVSYSPEWKRQIGYEDHEIGNTFEEWRSRVHPDDLEETLRTVNGTIERGSGEHEALFRFRHKDGSYRWILAHATILQDEAGDPVRMVGSHIDITERKRARNRREQELERSREMLLETGEMARVGGWEVDPETGRVRWSEVTRAVHEVDEDFHPALEDAYAFFPGGARDRIAEAVRRALEEGVPYDLELPFVTAKGDELWVHTIGKPDMEDGRCVRLHGTFQDITDLKERELELERVNRAQAFVAASNAALVRGTPDGGDDLLDRICDVALEEGGYSRVWIAYREDASNPFDVHQADHGAPIDLLTLEGLREEIDAAASVGVAFVARGLQAGDRPWERRLAEAGLAALVVLPFPAEFPIEGFISLGHTDPETLTPGEVGILGDLVSELAYGLWVRSLRQELLLIQEAVENLSTGVSILDATDPEKPLVYVNRGFARVTGYEAEEVLGRHCGDLLQGPDTDRDTSAEIEAALEEGRATQVTVLNYRKSGDPFWNRLTVEPVRDDQGKLTHFVAIQEDVTEQRRMGRELEHRERLSAVGELAGGVAHDFRNILTAAQGLLELSFSEADLDDTLRENLEHLRSLIARGSAVTERLLVLSRRSERDVHPVRLSDALGNAADLVERTIRDDIEVVVEDIGEPVFVRVDEDQFTTVILNLARNAEQAMPDVGRLTFDVTYPVAPGGPRWWPIGLETDSERAWVRLSVRDTGTGMDAETLDQAFDPYFTTKEAGEGTGLGLPMVYGVVEAMGGRTWIESEPGEGTTVHILLPTADSVAEERDETVSDQGPDTAEPRTGTILLAEDDPKVLMVFRKGLERAGHTVLSGEDGVEALDAFERDPSAVDLVVTDGFMPRMSGAQLGRAVWERRPDLPVIVTSGFGSEDIRSEFPDDPPGRLVFLPKPLSIDELLDAVQRLLPASRGDAS